MKMYCFPCGCSFEVIGPPFIPNGLPRIKLDPYNISPTCPKTWEILSRGETKGVFQLESPLGRQWCKTLKPEELEHMSALGALLRPGCLKAEVEPNISMTKLFCLRKNGERDVENFHPVLDEILKPTLGVLVYQEQSMRIGKNLAGFDLKQVDKLRKAIGKKDQKEMAAVREMFLSGAKDKAAVPFELAELVWSWIEKSGRYQFNKSHSLSYGILGYITAYLKTHFPLYFFTSWLNHAHDKADGQEEVRELVSEAKLFDVAVLPPDIRMLEASTQTDHISVVLGLTDVKGVGDAQVKKMTDAVNLLEEKLGKKITEWSWYEFLTAFSPLTTSSVIDRLIRVGAFKHLNMSRTRMQAEFDAWNALTAKEQAWIQALAFTDLLSSLKAVAPPKKEGGGAANKNRTQIITSRISLLEHPPSSLDDYPHWIASQEEELLGIALTITKAEATVDPMQVTTSCKEFLSGHDGRDGYIIMGVEVESAREVKCKQGKSAGRKMGFLTVSDSSCSLSDIVAFPDTWKEYNGLLQEGNCVYIHGERDSKKGSLIVKTVWQA